MPKNFIYELITGQMLQLSQQIAGKNETIASLKTELENLQDKFDEISRRHINANEREESLKNEKLVLAESVTKLNAKCRRMAETLANNGINHSKAKSNFDSESNALRSEISRINLDLRYVRIL